VYCPPNLKFVFYLCLPDPTQTFHKLLHYVESDLKYKKKKFFLKLYLRYSLSFCSCWTSLQSFRSNWTRFSTKLCVTAPFRHSVSSWTLSDLGSFKSGRIRSLFGDTIFSGSSDAEADLNLHTDVFSPPEVHTATIHNAHLHVDSPLTMKKEYSVSLILRHEIWNLEAQGPLHLMNFCFLWKAFLHTNSSPCWQPLCRKAVHKQHSHTLNTQGTEH
jgi:hypothetical protein